MKKIPQRSCIMCREKKNKNDLIRIIKNKENEIKIDKTGKMQGRGAYICDNISCIDKVIKNKKLDSIFEIIIPEEVYLKLKEDYLKEKNGGDIIG